MRKTLEMTAVDSIIHIISLLGDYQLLFDVCFRGSRQNRCQMCRGRPRHFKNPGISSVATTSHNAVAPAVPGVTLKTQQICLSYHGFFAALLLLGGCYCYYLVGDIRNWSKPVQNDLERQRSFLNLCQIGVYTVLIFFSSKFRTGVVYTVLNFGTF